MSATTTAGMTTRAAPASVYTSPVAAPVCPGVPTVPGLLYDTTRPDPPAPPLYPAPPALTPPAPPLAC